MQLSEFKADARSTSREQSQQLQTKLVALAESLKDRLLGPRPILAMRHLAPFWGEMLRCWARKRRPLWELLH